ncbi:MAG: hypothetical protein H7144_14715 [Burkholderiales bacterium]|nr:hypothetical protein [Phycisphaerae bacterium]
MATVTKHPTSPQSREPDTPSAATIAVAAEKLFGGGRGVSRFARSGMRYVKLSGNIILVEQNTKKRSVWAAKARLGQRIAWVMRNGDYLARVVDGEVVMLTK